MSGSGMRELIRRAQQAELGGEVDQAVELLQQAAARALEQAEASRAASLLRHCLRLAPARADLVERLERIPQDESAGLGADVVVDGDGDGDVGATRPRRDRRPREPSVSVPGQVLDLPLRGPTKADPSVDAWCSFCCRPKAEVGPVVAGPAGAFICGACIQAAARITAVGVDPAPAAVAAPAPGAALSPAPEPATPDFIEAAVLLSRALGWSLQEIRSLSADERRRALAVLRQPGRGGG